MESPAHVDNIGAVRGGVALAVAVLAAASVPGGAQAQAPDTRVGQASDGLPGLDRVGVPHSVPWMGAVGASAGYGFTESVLDADDSHHRLAGRAAFSLSPADIFALGLQLDGRYDTHSAGGASDDGLVGDPRLLLRGFTELGSVSLGAQATLWVPGKDAPSVAFDALSVDFEALLGLRVGDDLTLALNAGFRLDRSAASIEDATLLSPSDRIALGLSDSNALLVGLGAAYRTGQMELFGEWTWDLLLGNDAASASQSPMRVGAGARLWIGDSDSLQLEGRLEALLSSRPDVTIGQDLAPVDPRFGVHIGLLFRFPAPDRPSDGDDGGGVGDGGPGPVAPTTGTVRGRVTDSEGQPVVGAQVTIEPASGDALGPVTSGDDGSFEVTEVPAGTVTVHAVAEGYVEQTAEVTVTAGAPVEAQVAVERDLPNGQIRGVVQSFAGQPVQAQIRVEPLGQEVTADEEGAFQIDVPPGEYEVVITAEGYTEQRRPIRVEQQGVTILNVDLRRDRGRRR